MTATSKIGTTLGVKAGAIDETKAEAIHKSVQEAARSFRDFTPEQEYYIGRAVGATILKRYRPYENQEATLYLNVLGQTLARFSELPETFNGYHFLILDSDDINALSAPGGLIFISRGMLRCCEHEDALAAVLAHEIGHIQYKHGLQAIKTSRVTTALTTLAIKGAKGLGSAKLARLTETFEDSIHDITSTLISRGYSRAFEVSADHAAVAILDRVGYNPRGLVDMLEVMKKKLKPGGLDFARTHPSPSWRIAGLQDFISAHPEVKRPKARQDRFLKALGSV
ncbi:MAG: M48 family metalloprotease [Deltaproteobacteria bacterium]|nr:M48 family metalloprotease [Deltaproteobacteria bacterium]MBW2086548.1 M48 family metalloprotease [Deltaproteobacteria bacterium]